MAAEIKETVDNGTALGDIVRDDVAKATQIDEHSGVSDVSKYDSLLFLNVLTADHHHTSHKEESWPRPSYIYIYMNLLYILLSSFIKLY